MVYNMQLSPIFKTHEHCFKSYLTKRHYSFSQKYIICISLDFLTEFNSLFWFSIKYNIKKKEIVLTLKNFRLLDNSKAKRRNKQSHNCIILAPDYCEPVISTIYRSRRLLFFIKKILENVDIAGLWDTNFLL